MHTALCSPHRRRSARRTRAFERVLCRHCFPRCRAACRSAGSRRDSRISFARDTRSVRAYHVRRRSIHVKTKTSWPIFRDIRTVFPGSARQSASSRWAAFTVSRRTRRRTRARGNPATATPTVPAERRASSSILGCLSTPVKSTRCWPRGRASIAPWSPPVSTCLSSELPPCEGVEMECGGIKFGATKLCYRFLLVRAGGRTCAFNKRRRSSSSASGEETQSCKHTAPPIAYRASCILNQTRRKFHACRI